MLAIIFIFPSIFCGLHPSGLSWEKFFAEFPDKLPDIFDTVPRLFIRQLNIYDIQVMSWHLDRTS